MEAKSSAGTELDHPSSLTEKWLSDVFGEEVSSFAIDENAVAPDGAGTLSSLVGITVNTNKGRQIKVVAKFACTDEESKGFVDMAGLNVREAAFYKNAAHALNKLSEPHMVYMPLIPCFLALRCPLMLEDLRPKGFRMADALKGLTFAEAQCAMDALARFHAAGMMIGEELESGNDEEKSAAMQSHLTGLFDGGVKLTQEKLACENDGNKELVKYLDSLLTRSEEFADFTPQEPFGTIIHTDLWVYNLLFRYSEGGSVNDCVLLDWQFWSPRGSAGFDVATVLLSGLNPDDYKNNFHSLLKCYHSQLIETLKKLGCDENLLQRRSFSALEKHYRSQIEHVSVALLCAATIFFTFPELSKR